ncbi:hypothetical protein AC1031_002714 [Aphanomyces cochlioides]|nr:hypothetical protein AC1031_002714 [Aphanomyces cochlioides]
MAPEMLLHVGHGKPIDWWCLGIVACEILTGVHPFRGESQMRLLSNVVNSDPFLPPSLSPEAASLIQGFLCKQPKLRLGSVGRKFEDIKAHPFFAGLDWDKVSSSLAPAAESTGDRWRPRATPWSLFHTLPTTTT